MAKALIGYLDSDLRTPARLTTENARLRARVRDLEALVSRLAEENDRLTSAHAAALLDARSPVRQESLEDSMQPA